MKGKYKRIKGWCHNCDADIVEGGKKCNNCGCREYCSKTKKPNTIEILKNYYNA